MKNSVTFREKIGYGFGDMASSMFWKIFGMYLLFFYTKVFGITPAAAGTMFLVTRIWDSLNDPIMGLLADRTRSRWGRYRPYLLWGAFPFAAVGVLTFWTPDFGMTGKLAWAYITYTAMMMVYTMVNVPYASLLGVMTPDTKIRNTFSSYRMFFAYVGSLVTFMLLQPLVDFFAGRLGGGDTDRLSGSVAGSDVAISGMPEAWTCAVAVIGAICALLFWLCFRWTRERIRVDDAQLAEGSVGRDLKSLARNAPWWILLVAGVAVLLFNSIRDGVAIFYFTDYVRSAYKLPHLGWTLGTLYLLLGQLGNMAGVALAVPLAARIGKKGAFAAAMGAAAVLSLFFFRLEPSELGWLFALQALVSVAAGVVLPLLWSMYADIVDYEEYRSGRRPTGLIFSSSSMSQKLGWALGGAVTGWLLAAFGYDQSAAVQSGEAIAGVRLMMSWFPAAGCLLAAAAVLFYPLGEKRMERITTELNLRRETNE
ncbi:MFS transporter [Alistipes communis]|uniref:MFS transporter n=1 Tax=Alistipes communis TaxID=2585118 RepID=UPI003A8523F8